MKIQSKLLESNSQTGKAIDELVNEFITADKNRKLKGATYQVAVKDGDIHHFAFLTYEEKDENDDRKVGFGI